MRSEVSFAHLQVVCEIRSIRPIGFLRDLSGPFDTDGAQRPLIDL